MSLKDFSAGETGRITGFEKGSSEYRRRLLMLGATPGAVFEVLRVAPLGDPVEIKVRGSCISVRRDEIAVMHVEKISS